MLALLLAFPIAITSPLGITIDQIADKNSLLYFFSALAQCAAAFAALIGVFAVFRLQANDSVVIRRYNEVAKWLRAEFKMPDFSHIDRIDTARFNVIKEALIGTYSDKTSDLSKEYMAKLEEAEQFPETLPNVISLPLVLWAVVFFVSLWAIPFTKLLEQIGGLEVCAITLLFVLFVLWKTRKVIQKCLGTK